MVMVNSGYVRTSLGARHAFPWTVMTVIAFHVRSKQRLPSRELFNVKVMGISHQVLCILGGRKSELAVIEVVL